jgi:hypothetical protein
VTRSTHTIRHSCPHCSRTLVPSCQTFEIQRTYTSNGRKYIQRTYTSNGPKNPTDIHTQRTEDTQRTYTPNGPKILNGHKSSTGRRYTTDIPLQRNPVRTETSTSSSTDRKPGRPKLERFRKSTPTGTRDRRLPNGSRVIKPSLQGESVTIETSTQSRQRRVPLQRTEIDLAETRTISRI